MPVSYRRTLYLALWGLVVLTVTLTPDPSPSTNESFGSLCLFCGGRGLADAMLNTVLFVPLGMLLGPRVGFVRGLALGAALSLGIELTQLLLPGRFPTLGDVVFNGLGAGLGTWIVRAPRRVVSWSAPGGVLGLLAPLVLLAPAPPEGIWYGQWTAELGHLEHYDGRVLEAEVGGIPVPEGRSARSGELAETLRRRPPIHVRFLAGTPPAGLAPVFSIYDHRRQEALLLGVDGEDLVFRTRVRADRLRLDRPEWRLKGALAGVEKGDSIRAEVLWSSGSSPCLSLNRSTQCAVAPGFATGWSLLLYPSPLASDAPIDWLWAGLMAFPLGWVLGGSRRAAVAALLLAPALLGLSILSPDLRPTVWPAAALVAGAVLGGLAAERWA